MMMFTSLSTEGYVVKFREPSAKPAKNQLGLALPKTSIDVIKLPTHQHLLFFQFALLVKTGAGQIVWHFQR